MVSGDGDGGAGGEAAGGSCEEMAGPYGVGEGERLDPSICVLGSDDGGALRELCLRDLCDGPPVVLTVQAVWAQTNKEMGPPAWIAPWGEVTAAGAATVGVLVDSEDPGTPADEQNLDTWVPTFDLEGFWAIDPDYELGALVGVSEYPVFWLVDGRALEVWRRVNGVPTDAFWDAVTSALAE